MSNGKTHEKVNFLYLMLIVPAVLIFFKWDIISALILVAGYIVGTYWMNPDLDIKSKPYGNWLFLKYFWRPYQLLGHRSIWTHGYILGDVIRYAYLYLLFILFSYGLSFVSPMTIESNTTWLKQLVMDNQRIAFLFFLGNVLSSSAHIIQDHMSSGLKRVTKPYRKKAL